MPEGPGRARPRAGFEPEWLQPGVLSPRRISRPMWRHWWARMVGHHTGPGSERELQRILPKWVGFPVAAVRCWIEATAARLLSNPSIKRLRRLLISLLGCWLFSAR